MILHLYARVPALEISPVIGRGWPVNATRNRDIRPMALSSLSNLSVYPISCAIRLVSPAIQSPTWKALYIFRAENSDASAHGSRGTKSHVIHFRNRYDRK